MSDGASVTVRPDSELRFDRYRYALDGEASALLVPPLGWLSGRLARLVERGYLPGSL